MAFEAATQDPSRMRPAGAAIRRAGGIRPVTVGFRDRRRAFTLLEVLVVILVMGLLSTMIVGGFSNVVPAGREVAAVNKARILNAARVTYALTVPDAATQWAAALTDTDRSALLVNAGALTGTASDWLAAGGGYTLSLSGGLKAKTILKTSAGTVLNYPD